MTVFCPNCGKPNTDEASACAACGTELKAASPKVAASKFKGTMMMSGVQPPKPQGPGGGLPPPAAPPPQAAPPPEAKQNMAFQATMLGPMTPPPGAAPAGPPAQGGGFGAPPPAQGGGFGAPPPAQGGGFGAPPPAQGGGFGAPPPAQGGGFGAPPPAQGGGFGAPPPAQGGGFGAPPPAQGGGFGAPPPAQGGGFGAPPPAQGGGFGAPPPAQGGGFGAPPAQGGGFGAPPAQGGGFGGDAGAPAPKKSSTLKYVGIGCLVFVLLSCLCGGGYTVWGMYRAKQALAAAGMTGSDTGAAGGTCAKAKACCEAVYSQPALAAQAAQVCAGVDQAAATPFGDVACGGLLETFKQAGAGMPGGVPAACN